MSDVGIAWLFFVGYLTIIGAAATVGIRRMKGLGDFAVGDRKVSPLFVGLSLAANLTSAATFIVNPGLLYLSGVSGFLGYAIATPLGIMVGLTVLSKAFRRVGDRYSALTVPQWIGDRYGSWVLKTLFAGISLLLITFLILIVVGLTLVLSSVLGLPEWAAMAITIAVPLVYIMLGGASAHTLTSTVQAAVMLIVAVLLIGSGIAYFSDGLGGFLDRLAAIDPLLAAPVNPKSPLFRSAFEVFVANFVIGLAVVTQPHIISKALYLRTERDVNTYLATGFAVLIVFFCVLVVGLYARLLFPAGDLAPDRVVPTYLVDVFSPGVRGLVAMGLVAAGFSTLEGLLLALSAIFANDIYGAWARRHSSLSEEERSVRAVRYGKLFMVALVPVLALASWQQIQSPNLSVAILAQNGVYALFSATFAPILFGIFADRMPAWGAGAAALSALIVHFGMYYGQIGPYWNNPAVPATFALATSVLVAGVALVLTRPAPVPTAVQP